MGSAEGSIIATIMTVSRIRKTTSASGFVAVLSGIMSSATKSMEDHVTTHASATAIATATAMGAVSCRSMSGARVVSVVKGPRDGGRRYERAPEGPERALHPTAGGGALRWTS